VQREDFGRKENSPPTGPRRRRGDEHEGGEVGALQVEKKEEPGYANTKLYLPYNFLALWGSPREREGQKSPTQFGPSQGAWGRGKGEVIF